MFAIVRGNAETGFTLYGPFRTATMASRKGRQGELVAHLHPPPHNPDDDAYDSIEAYTARVLLDQEPWALVKGNFNDGYKFFGSFDEEDADEECCHVDDDTAVIRQILLASEL
jgi:hypothetical protein